MEKSSSEMEFDAFPYKPYSIQLDFMKFLYRSLDRGGIAMLESPTGTGKTLSVICSALQWLVDMKKQETIAVNGGKKLGEDDQETDDPDWIRNFVPNEEPALAKKKAVIPKKRIDLLSSRERCRKEKATDKEMIMETGIDEADDREFLVEDRDSDEENGGRSKRKNIGRHDAFSSEEDEEANGLGAEDDEARLKVYFCSRTHSQLSQFMKELRKTKFTSELKVVCLGSRKNLCINEGVLKLGSLVRINERCVELQKSKKLATANMKRLDADRRVPERKASTGCPMLTRQKVEELTNEISRLEALDIEDLVDIGHNLGSCPYYGSRRMIPAADLVVLPYQSLLSKSSRESLGLTLKGSVVIIDEAHNLADTLINMYDAKIRTTQLKKLQGHLEGYFLRFCDLLGPGNRRYIQILKILIQAFLQILYDGHKVQSLIKSHCDAEEIRSGTFLVMTINEFLFASNIDNINLVKLLRWMKESNIIYKVSGYGDKAAVSQKVGNNKEVTDSAITCFRAFVGVLSSLTNQDSAGKIIVSRPKETCDDLEEGCIKYVMLTGERIFSEIADQAHAVILVGGTLQPIEETKERLFPSKQLDQLPFFSCGHIIPSENILPVAVKHGPSGKSFDFSYKMRSSSTMVEELGLLLCNLVNVVPEGIVVFFSSFDYESEVYLAWKGSGILSRITKKKRIFREPRKSTNVEAVLREYKETVDSFSDACSTSCNGAVLLAVVGGKISEGINLSDGAGRCIVMVGLPYPSPSDVELMERVKHIEGLAQAKPTNNLMSPIHLDGQKIDAENGFRILKSCKGRGKEYYENLCMKAVNQSIGRAIRHINDYAAILLVDARYASDSMENSFSHPTRKLPQWIKRHLVTTTANYGEVQKMLHHFFKFHKKKEAMSKDIKEQE